MRWRSVVIALLLTGCNKGKPVIEEAQTLHRTGEVELALTKLETVRDIAPGTPEVAEAAELAVGWLIEAADASEDLKAERDLLGRALKWKPSSGQAQVGLCEVEASEKNLDALRVCIQKLADAEGVPQERKKDLLAKAERMELSASASPKEWLRLAQTWPESDEAKEITPRLLRHYSLCHDVERFAGFIEGSLETLLKLEQQMKVELRLSKSGDIGTIGRGLDAINTVHRHAVETLASTKERRNRLLTHETITGEDTTKRMLLDVYEGQQMLLQHYADNYGDVMTMMRSLAVPTQTLVNAARATVGEVRDRCTLLLAANPKVLEGLSEPVQKGAAAATPSAMNSWLSAQSSGDFAAYAAFYSAGFVGVKNVSGHKKQFDRAGWLNDRKGMFNKSFHVEASEVETKKKGALEIVTFTQHWKSDSYEDVGTKELHFSDGKIIREEQLTSDKPLPGPSESAWKAVKEVTVTGSSALNCQTKMLSGYLRVFCGPNSDGTPTSVTFDAGSEPEGAARLHDGRLLLVHPYKEGVSFAASFSWADATHRLRVHWPAGAPKPVTAGVFDSTQ